MRSSYILLIILIILTPSFIYGQQRVTVIQPFNSIYAILGNYNTHLKFQVSFKMSILWKYLNGIKLGYNQLVWWKVYNRSNPIEDINYNPSLFYEHEFYECFTDFFRIGFYEHKSNGKDHEKGRGYDYGFFEIQNSIGKIINIGNRTKVWYYYLIGYHNQNIGEYIGNSETELFIKIKGKRRYIEHEKLYCKGGIGGTFFGNEQFSQKRHFGMSDKFWLEFGLSSRFLLPCFSYDLYVQYYYGYGEFLLKYDKKVSALRVGIIFNN